MLAVLTSCGVQPDEPRIAASAGVVDTTAVHWHLVEPAIFVLGLDEAEDAAVFHGIVAIHRNTHGDVFVADGFSREIRVFDRNGQFVRRFGGPGGGPGEFATLRGVDRIAADTLFGLDSFAARVTIMHEDGTVIRTVRLNTGPSEWLARAEAG